MFRDRCLCFNWPGVIRAQFLSVLISVASFQDRTRLGLQPLASTQSRDNYSLSDSDIWMKNAYVWGSKQLIKRLTLPHSCLCLQRGPFLATVAGKIPPVCVCSHQFVWVILDSFLTSQWPLCFNCFSEVYFQSSEKKLAVPL